MTAATRGSGERVALEPFSLKDYRTSVDLHITPRIGSQALSKLTAPDVVEFRATLLKEVSRAKAQRVLKHLRQALNFAVVAGYIASNPALAVRIAADSREKPRPDIPSRTEMQAIVAELTERVTDKPKVWTRFATLFHLLQGTGLRISEARGLTWDAVDLQEGVIQVSRRLDNANQMGRVKSAASRRIVILDTTQIEWLKRWQPMCVPGELGLVFPNGLGKAESYQNFYHRFWKPVCAKLGLVTETGTPRYAFHDTRHYRVSELIASGANLRETMSEIGHASSALTLDRYGHLFPEDTVKRRERAERIAQNLGQMTVK